jgi:hypothetical protein
MTGDGGRLIDEPVSALFAHTSLDYGFVSASVTLYFVGQKYIHVLKRHAIRRRS